MKDKVMNDEQIKKYFSSYQFLLYPFILHH